MYNNNRRTQTVINKVLRCSLLYQNIIRGEILIVMFFFYRLKWGGEGKIKKILTRFLIYFIHSSNPVTKSQTPLDRINFHILLYDKNTKKQDLVFKYIIYSIWRIKKHAFSILVLENNFFMFFKFLFSYFIQKTHIFIFFNQQ